MKRIIFIIIIFGLYYIFKIPIIGTQYYSDDSSNYTPQNFTYETTSLNDDEPIKEPIKVHKTITRPSITRPSITKSKSTRYKCNGRQYCSQMTSCPEAKYFLANCPNPKMDGDGDGIPCERQWCGR